MLEDIPSFFGLLTIAVVNQALDRVTELIRKLPSAFQVSSLIFIQNPSKFSFRINSVLASNERPEGGGFEVKEDLEFDNEMDHRVSRLREVCKVNKEQLANIPEDRCISLLYFFHCDS